MQDMGKVSSLTAILDAGAQELQKEPARCVLDHLFSDESSTEPTSEFRKNLGADQALWVDLRKLWKDLARSKLTFWDNDDDEEEAEASLDQESRYVRSLCQAVAKFTRNLVAGVPENQVRA